MKNQDSFQSTNTSITRLALATFSSGKKYKYNYSLNAMPPVQEKVTKYKKTKATEIPLIVWLLENPESIISLPGKISLQDHDYLHSLLDCNRSPTGEAIVIGSCMGSDPNTKKIHILIFKLFARYVYPQAYKLSKKDLTNFDRGFDYGKYLYRKNKVPLNQIKSSQFNSVEQARIYLGINVNFLHQKQIY